MKACPKGMSMSDLKCPACGGTGDRQAAGQVENCHECGGTGERKHRDGCPLSHIPLWLASCACGREEAPFAVGESVTKHGGDYSFRGQIVSVFTKRSGQTRYVVENEAGILHIFSAKNLRSVINDAP